MFESRELTKRDIRLKSDLPWVVHLAKAMHNRLPDSVHLDDLIQTGLIGLNRAYDDYDSSRGVAFKAYASSVIWRAMKDGIRETDPLSRGIRKAVSAHIKVKDALRKNLGREPRLAELAEASKSSIEDIGKLELNYIYGNPISIQELIAVGDDGISFSTLEENTKSMQTDESPETLFFRREAKREVDAEILNLTKLQREAIQLMSKERSEKECAELVGVNCISTFRDRYNTGIRALARKLRSRENV